MRMGPGEQFVRAAGPGPQPQAEMPIAGLLLEAQPGDFLVPRRHRLYVGESCPILQQNENADEARTNHHGRADVQSAYRAAAVSYKRPAVTESPRAAVISART